MHCYLYLCRASVFPARGLACVLSRAQLWGSRGAVERRAPPIEACQVGVAGVRFRRVYVDDTLSLAPEGGAAWC